jgi:hypothetical protein
MNDVDCAFSIYQMSNTESDQKVVEFRREKDRGDVVAKISYSYIKRHGGHYLDIIDSVERVGYEDAERISRDAEITQYRRDFESEITNSINLHIGLLFIVN